MIGRFFQRRKFRKQLKELIGGVTYTLACDDDILEESRKRELRAVREELKGYAAKCDPADRIVNRISDLVNVDVHSVWCKLCHRRGSGIDFQRNRLIQIEFVRFRRAGSCKQQRRGQHDRRQDNRFS